MLARINFAVSVEPVNATPPTRGSEVNTAPTSPAPRINCKAARGTPASRKSDTARWAISGVCSAGFAKTALPAAKAALTWPVKIASGKFHGEIHVNVPMGVSSVVRSA